MAEEQKVETTKKKGLNEEKLEVFVAILLGVTAILTAWASWIGSLHGGNQATNYTKSNNMSAMGNSMYNEAVQKYTQDADTWNHINDYIFDRDIAEAKGDDITAEMMDEKIDLLMSDNCSDEFRDAIDWAFDQDWAATPFDNEEFFNSYFTEAQETLDEADLLLQEGQKDNANGDAYGLVSVIYSLVLFLLGIVGIFKRLPNRKVVLIIGAVLLVIGMIYMFTIPMPTGFNPLSFFVH